MSENLEETNEHKEGELEIVYKLHGTEAVRKLRSFIESRVEPVKEKYPYAKIRIEVTV